MAASVLSAASGGTQAGRVTSTRQAEAPVTMHAVSWVRTRTPRQRSANSVMIPWFRKQKGASRFRPRHSGQSRIVMTSRASPSITLRTMPGARISSTFRCRRSDAAAGNVLVRAAAPAEIRDNESEEEA